jgi:cyanophycinase
MLGGTRNAYWFGLFIALSSIGCSNDAAPTLLAISSHSDKFPSTAEPQAPQTPTLTVACGKPAHSNSETSASSQTVPRGALLMAGGGLRYDNSEIWSRFIQQARKYAIEQGEPADTAPRVAVMPTASFTPEQSGGRIAEALKKFGADPFVVPIAIKNASQDARVAVRDPAIVKQIQSAHGIFFSGGQQARITEALVNSDGTPTPALEAIWRVYEQGGIIGGTSAGTAIMSRIMCRAVDSQLELLKRGVTEGKETTAGLGFLDPNWFVDQHFIIRARFARALAVIKHHGLRHGLGIDENTAVLVQKGQTEIIGYRGAIFLDLSEAEFDAENPSFNVRNARVSYLDRGDRLNMQTLVLTPSHEKLAEKMIDPSSPSFEPDNHEPIFTPDILGNSTLLDTMRRLMNSSQPHAMGLAFDSVAAAKGPVPAFEFRFYRGDDTRAWPPGAGEDYTIANVHLDVRRVEVESLVYR